MDDRYWVGPFDDLDRYRLTSQIGHGGEGAVWKASLDLSAEGQSLRAIKVLEISDANDQNQWLDHVNLLTSLDHPGIVRVIEVFIGPKWHRAGQLGTTIVEPGSTAAPAPSDAAPTHRYVVMNFVDGESLTDWLAEEPRASTAQRIKSLRTVAAALDYMHSGEGTRVPVAHGDVKPTNIIRRADASTVLVDLGLTRLADGRGRVGHTRAYAAPELFQPGARVTPASDRFAFAMTVVHVLLGRTPPTINGVHPDLPAIEEQLRKSVTTAGRPELVNNLMAALRCPPERRPPNLSRWLTTLTETLSSTTGASGTGDFTPELKTGVPPVPARPGRPPAGPNRRRTITVAAVVLALGLAAGLFTFWPEVTGATTTSAPPSSAPVTASAQPSATTEDPSPGPDDSAGEDPESSPTDTSDPTGDPTGTSDPSATPSGVVEGTLIAGPDATESGIIVTRSENAVYGMDVDAEDFTINGHAVQYGWSSSCKLFCKKTEQSYVELNLGRKYTSLKATFGIADSSSGSGPITIQCAVLDNNQTKVIYNKRFTVGSGGPQTVNVTGVLRLKITFIGPLGSTNGALGDPTLY